MKALTLWEPWATLVAIGAKRFETRSWSTRYRGRLALHVSKRLDPDSLELLREEPFHSAFLGAGITRHEQLHPGCVIALAHLLDVSKIQRIGPNGRLVFCDDRSGFHPHSPRDIVTVGTEPLTEERELAFGKYCTGRYAWRLERVALVKPVPVRGAQGLWSWPDALTVLEYAEGCHAE